MDHANAGATRTGARTVRLGTELHLLASSRPFGRRPLVITACGMPVYSDPARCEGTTDSPDCDINEICDNCVKAWANEEEP